MLATAACATPHTNSGSAAAMINLAMMLDAQTPHFTSFPYREVSLLPSDYVAEIRQASQMYLEGPSGTPGRSPGRNPKSRLANVKPTQKEPNQQDDKKL